MKHNVCSLVISFACALAATTSMASDQIAKKTHHHYKHHQEMKESNPVKNYVSVNEDYNFATVKGGLVNPTPLGGNTGLNVGNDTYTVGLSVGRKFQDIFALELEYMYRGKNTAKAYNSSANPGNDNTEWKASSNTIMANAMIDLLKCEKFRPYLKAGIGMSINKGYDYVYNQTTVNVGVSQTSPYTYAGKKNNSFAWQVGAGINMRTTEMFDTQLQYMYVDRGAVKTKANYYDATANATINASPIKGWMKEHVITVGITTRF